MDGAQVIPFSVSLSKDLSLQYERWDFGVRGSTYCLVGDNQLDHRQRIKHSNGNDVPTQVERTRNGYFQNNNANFALFFFLKKESFHPITP